MGGIQTAIKMWVEVKDGPTLPSLAGSVFESLKLAGREYATATPPGVSAGSPPSKAVSSSPISFPSTSRRSKPPTNTGLEFLD